MTESDIQQVLLKKLKEYGESVLESSEKKHKRKKKHKLCNSETDQAVSSNKHTVKESENDSSLSKRRKKKKRKLHDNESSSKDLNGIQQTSPDKGLTQSGKIRHIESIKNHLGLTEFKERQLEKEKVKERSDTGTKKAPEVVVFTSHKKKQREESNRGRSTSDNPQFDLKQARFEVRKFGIKGFEGDKKEEAMTSLLIRLGAKPPKNKCHNYVEYQEMRKKEMAAEREKRELDRKLGYKIPKATNDRKRKRDRNDIGIVDGQVGRWKSGVQFVKKNDLKGLKKSKIKF